MAIEFGGKRVWVVGAARSCLSVCKLLLRSNAKLFVTDSGEITQKNKDELKALGIPFEENSHSTEKLASECDMLVVSPGVLLDRGLPLEARKHFIPVCSEIEVASKFISAEHTVIGITGTNGKSTTTHYLAQLSARAQRPTISCGNIGLPFSQAVLENKHRVFSLELSSYQLESTSSLIPRASIVLNIQNDHLLRYGSLDEYLKAKWRLVILTSKDGLCILGADVLRRALRIGLPLPACEIVVVGERSEISANLPNKGAELPIPTYGTLSDLGLAQLMYPRRLSWAELETNGDGISVEIALRSKKRSWIINEPCLPGEHNAYNLLCASIAALDLGISEEVILAQWEKSSSQFIPLAHRLELVSSGLATDSRGKSKNISLINDSKATNVESTLVALKSYPKNLRVLVGGEPKGETFEKLKKFHKKSVISFYAFGSAASLIQNDLGDSCAGVFKSMLDSCEQALADSSDGDLILLSPACSSFDEFENFEHRGDIFREWALNKKAKSI